MFKLALSLVASVLLAQCASGEPVRLEDRQILSTITSDFGDVTSAVVSIATAGASDVTSAFGVGTSDAASAFSDLTSFGDGVFETVTSVGGSLVTIVTSEGGKAITLAGSAIGSAAETVTSFAGHEFTIAASEATASSNAGLTQYESGPILASILTLVVGATFGAFIIL
ncbi:hypothetical protein DFJ43DRAFT_1061378 [Lentinula guzmanii]|uniref:Uncharacterized protein n=1 Tax=Lentinula guzmanii TaxID=2804957 RepID=A0AA38JQN4_9AGAR|nr:hypothetical protein DFJ43DRAFT_1061378 [Lentinula guzmanii]